MALSGYAREHASLSIGSTHRRPRACGESCNDMRVQAEHERLAAQALASRLKGIEAWSALDSSGPRLRGWIAGLRHGLLLY